MVDGRPQTITTTARTVADALAPARPARPNSIVASAPMDAAIPVNGMNLDVRVPKTVTLVDGGGAPRQVTTTALNTPELLAQNGLALGPPTPSPAATPDRRLDDHRHPQHGQPGHRDPSRSRRRCARSTTRTSKRARPASSRPGPRARRSSPGRSTPPTAARPAARQVGESRVTRQAVGGVMARGTKPKSSAPAVSNGSQVGPHRPLRGDRQLVDQHRQRLLRRPAVRPLDLAGLRRRRVRRRCRTRPPARSRSRSPSASATDRGGYGAWPVCGSKYGGSLPPGRAMTGDESGAPARGAVDVRAARRGARPAPHQAPGPELRPRRQHGAPHRASRRGRRRRRRARGRPGPRLADPAAARGRGRRGRRRDRPGARRRGCRRPRPSGHPAADLRVVTADALRVERRATCRSPRTSWWRTSPTTSPCPWC